MSGALQQESRGGKIVRLSGVGGFIRLCWAVVPYIVQTTKQLGMKKHILVHASSRAMSPLMMLMNTLLRMLQRLSYGAAMSGIGPSALCRTQPCASAWMESLKSGTQERVSLVLNRLTVNHL